MNREKTLLSRRPVAGLLHLIIWFFFCVAGVAQDKGKSAAEGKATLAEEQLLGIVKKHETLLGQYEENPEKFEARELSTRVQSVINAYKAFNEDNPNDVFGFVLHGKFLREIGQYDEAYKLFQKANELDPNIAIVKQQLGNYLAESGKYDEAYPYFVSAVKLDPEKAVYQYQLGAHLILFRKQLLDEGVVKPAEYDKQLSRSLSEAVRLAPDELKYRRLYAESFYDLQKPDWEKALKTWSGLLVPGVTDTEAQAIHLHRARILAQLGREEEAREVLAGVTHPALAATKRVVSEKLGKPSGETPTSPAVPRPSPAVTAANKALQAEVEQLRKELANLKEKPVPPKPALVPSVPVEQHNKALSELQGSLRKLETEKKALLEALSTARGELAAKPKTISLEDHQKMVAQLEKSVEDAGKAKTDLEADLAKSAEVISSIRKDLTLAVAERDTAKNDLKKQMQDAQALAAQLAKEKQDLQARMEALQKDSPEAARKLVADLQRQLLELKKQNEGLAELKAKQDKEIQFLNKELDNFEDKLLSMVDSKSKTERQQAAAIKVHLASIESMKAQVREKEEARLALLRAVEEKTRDAEDLRKKLQGLSAQGKLYKEFAALLKDAVGEVSDDNLDLLGKVEVVQKDKLKSLEAELLAHEDLNRKLAADLAEQKDKAAVLQAAAEKQTQLAEDRGKELEALASQQGAAAKKMQADILQKTQRVAALEKELATSQARATEIGKQAAQAMKDAQEQADAAKAQKLVASRLAGEVADARKQVGARDKAVVDLQGEVQRLNKLSAELGRKAEQGGAAVAALEGQARTMKAGLAAMTAERDRLKTENVALASAVEQQGLDADKLGSTVQAQSAVAALFADWAITLTEEVAQQQAEVPVVAESTELKEALVRQTALASTRADEVRELRQQLTEARASLNQTEATMRDFEKNLGIQNASFQEMEATLRANVEKALALKQEVEKKLAEAQVTIAEQSRQLEAHDDHVSAMKEDLEASLGWVELLAGELGDRVDEGDRLSGAQAQEVEALKERLKNQDKLLARSQSDSGSMEQELEKAKALLQAGDERLVSMKKAVLDLQETNQVLSKDLAQVRRAMGESEKLVEEKDAVIANLTDSSEQAAAAVAERQKKLQAQVEKVKELETVLAASQDAEKERVREISVLQAKLEAAGNQLTAAQAALKTRHSPDDDTGQALHVATLELLVEDLAGELAAKGDTNALDQLASQAEALSVELEASRTAEAESRKMVAALEAEKAALALQAKKLAEESTEPLKKDLLAEQDKSKALTLQLDEQAKENKFLSAELKSLEDSLLATLDKHSRTEKLAQQRVADLQKQLEHAQKAVAVMKDAMAGSPDKSTLADLEKKAALLKVYEQQLKDLQASNADLKKQLAQDGDALRKQLVLAREKLKVSEVNRESGAALSKAQADELAKLKEQVADLDAKLKVASVPDDARVKELQNQLKIAEDTSATLRVRLRGIDEERVKKSEQLLVAQADLGRNRQLLSEMKTRVEALGKLQPGEAMREQLETVRKQLDDYKESGARRLAKLSSLEAELEQTRRALEDKEANEAAFAGAYRAKLVKIVSDSAKLQQALEVARGDLLQTRVEKNNALTELARKNADSAKQIRELQGQLADLRSQVEIRPAASSQERELLVQTMERLGKSESTIQALEASLSASQAQNRQLAVNQAKLLAKLDSRELVPSSPAPDLARINQLELALQDSRAKLAQRDKDFKDIVAKMNRVLERLHASPAPPSP